MHQASRDGSRAPQSLLLETQASGCSGCGGGACGGGGGGGRARQRNSAGSGPRASSGGVAELRGERGRHGHACRHRPRPGDGRGGVCCGACSAGTGGACSVAKMGDRRAGCVLRPWRPCAGWLRWRVARCAGWGPGPGVEQVGSGGGAGAWSMERAAQARAAGNRAARHALSGRGKQQPAGEEGTWAGGGEGKSCKTAAPGVPR